MKRFFAVFFLLFFFTGFVLAVERGASWDRVCNATHCTLTTYSAPVNLKNASGQYVPFTDAVNFSWSGGLNGGLNLSWNQSYVLLKPFVIYNGVYRDLSQVKSAFPSVNFKERVDKKRGSYKWALNFTGIPDSVKNNVDFIGLDLVEAKGVSWSDVRLERSLTRLVVHDVIELNYGDLIQTGFTLTFTNKTRLLIGNVSGKNSLWLDPTTSQYNLMTSGASGRLSDSNGVSCPTSASAIDTNTAQKWQVGDNYIFMVPTYDVFRTYYSFNTSDIPDDDTIDNANLTVDVDTAGDDNSYIYGNGYWGDTLETADWGIGTTNNTNGMITTTSTGTKTIDLDTSFVNKTGYTQLEIMSADEECGSLENVAGFTAVDTFTPYLNITYSTAGGGDNAPTITLNAPADTFNSSGSTLDFNGTPQDDINATNVSLYTNFSGWTANQTNNTPYNNTLTNFEVTGISDGAYLWNLQVCDNATGTQCAFATSNRTVTIDTTLPSSFSFVSPTDSNNSFVSRNYYYVNATFTETNPHSCLLEVGGANVSMTLTANSYCELNRTSQADGEYNFRVYLNDSAGNWGASNLRRVTLDTTIPNTIAYVSPTEADSAFLSQNYYYVNVTFSETNPDSCWLEVGGSNVSMTRSGTNCFINRTSQSDGVYSYKVYVNDSANNFNASASRSLTLDTTNPSLSFVSPTESDNAFVARNYFTVNASLTETNVALCVVELDDSNTTISPTGGAYCLYNATSQSDSAHTYTMYANDSAGNWGGTAQRTVTVDTTIPNNIAYVSPTDDSNDFVARNYYYVNVTFDETNSDTCWLEVGGSNVSMTRSGTNCYVNRTGQSDGAYAFRVYVNDSANNFNASASRTVTLDTTNPSLSYVSPTESDNAWVSRDYFTVNATLTETNQELCVAEVNSTNTTVSVTGSAYCIHNATGQAEGAHTYRIYANDSAGNWGGEAQRTVNIDTVPPTDFSYVSPTDSNNSFNNRNYYFVNSTFTELNPSACLLEVGGSNVSMTLQGTSYCFVNRTGQSDGNYSYRVYLNDSANNWNASFNQTIVLDTSIPQISLVAPSPANNSYQPANYIFVNASFTETNPHTCTLSWNAVNETATNSGGTCNLNKTSLADGNYSFVMYLNDSAGLVNATSNRTVVVDSVFPQFAFVSPTESNGSTVNVSYTYVNVTITDDYLDWYRVESNFSGSDANTTFSDSVGTTYGENFTSVSNGYYYYRVWANDSAGNMNISLHRFVNISVVSSDVRSSSISTNTTDLVIGDSLEHRVFWQSFTDANLSAYVFSSNYSGAWVNNTYVNFSEVNNSWSNVSAQTNTTVSGTYGWQVYANDTGNNWNGTGIQTIIVANVSVDRVVINSPANGSVMRFPFSFSFTPSGNNASYSCLYSFNGQNTTVGAVNNNTLTTAEISGAAGNYDLNATCNATRNGITSTLVSSNINFYGIEQTGGASGGGAFPKPSPTPEAVTVEELDAVILQRDIDTEATFVLLLGVVAIYFLSRDEEEDEHNPAT